MHSGSHGSDGGDRAAGRRVGSEQMPMRKISIRKWHPDPDVIEEALLPPRLGSVNTPHAGHLTKR